jgi:hypothetical protein
MDYKLTTHDVWLSTWIFGVLGLLALPGRRQAVSDRHRDLLGHPGDRGVLRILGLILPIPLPGLDALASSPGHVALRCSWPGDVVVGVAVTRTGDSMVRHPWRPRGRDRTHPGDLRTAHPGAGSLAARGHRAAGARLFFW